MINNSPLNWALSPGQTLAAGSHTIEIRTRNGFNGASALTNNGPLLTGHLTVAVIKN